MPIVPTVPQLPPWLLVEQGFEDQRPKMVLGHNFDHMAPFGILEAGFCMAFRRASFSFWAPGAVFWNPDPNLDPRFQNWLPTRPGRGFEQVWGPPKTWFCGGLVFKIEIMGFPATQMNCMVHRRPLGEPVSPQTPLKNSLPRNSPKSRNLGNSPLALPVDLLFSLRESPIWPFFLRHR